MTVEVRTRLSPKEALVIPCDAEVIVEIRGKINKNGDLTYVNNGYTRSINNRDLIDCYGLVHIEYKEDKEEVELDV